MIIILSCADVAGVPFMINVTLPDEKSNYVHRIGRVGRAERMGLAVSLVAAVPEKVRILMIMMVIDTRTPYFVI